MKPITTRTHNTQHTTHHSSHKHTIICNHHIYTTHLSPHTHTQPVSSHHTAAHTAPPSDMTHMRTQSQSLSHGHKLCCCTNPGCRDALTWSAAACSIGYQDCCCSLLHWTQSNIIRIWLQVQIEFRFFPTWLTQNLIGLIWTQICPPLIFCITGSPKAELPE